MIAKQPWRLAGPKDRVIVDGRLGSRARPTPSFTCKPTMRRDPRSSRCRHPQICAVQLPLALHSTRPKPCNNVVEDAIGNQTLLAGRYDLCDTRSASPHFSVIKVVSRITRRHPCPLTWVDGPGSKPQKPSNVYPRTALIHRPRFILSKTHKPRLPSSCCNLT